MTFGTLKFVLHIISLIGWFLIVAGLALLLSFASGTSNEFGEINSYLSREHAFTLWLYRLAPYLSLIVTGILFVAFAQLGFAFVATAENTAETAKNTAKILAKIQPNSHSNPPLQGRVR